MGDNRIPRILSDYYERAVPEAPSEPRGTSIAQVGEMRLAPDKPWMPFSAEQTISASETRFCWRARFKMAPLVTGMVEDAFENGQGRLDAKLWGLFSLAHARGPAVDRAEAQRYLAELVWSPMALVCNPELRFGEAQDGRLRIWVGDERTYVDLLFDEHGDVAGARTETRSRDGEPQPWEGRFWDYQDFDGIRAPSRGEVWWDAPDGKFVYWRGTVTGLRWNEGE